MTAGARLATFALLLVAAFALAFGVGAAMDGDEPAGGDRIELRDVGPHDETHEGGGA